jgi:hypothetical protein
VGSSRKNFKSDQEFHCKSIYHLVKRFSTVTAATSQGLKVLQPALQVELPDSSFGGDPGALVAVVGPGTMPTSRNSWLLKEERDGEVSTSNHERDRRL